MSERDPKIDPISGDSFRKREEMRSIDNIDNTHVEYCDKYFIGHRCTIKAHRKWAATAEVVRRAEEA